jgi:hypothetical protein
MERKREKEVRKGSKNGRMKGRTEEREKIEVNMGMEMLGKEKVGGRIHFKK